MTRTTWRSFFCAASSLAVSAPSFGEKLTKVLVLSVSVNATAGYCSPVLPLVQSPTLTPLEPNSLANATKDQLFLIDELLFVMLFASWQGLMLVPGIVPQVLSLEACMQMDACSRTPASEGLLCFTLTPSWPGTPQGVYPNPSNGGGGVLYYPPLLHTLQFFLMILSLYTYLWISPILPSSQPTLLIPLAILLCSD